LRISFLDVVDSLLDAPVLWVCDSSEISDQSLLERYRQLLDPVELARLERFRFASDRHLFLVSHALLRCVLGRSLDREPASLVFERGVHGKPLLSDPAPSSVPLSFNLSHSGGQAVVAVRAGAAAIGVDIESHRPGRRFAALAERYFSSEEVRALSAVHAEARSERFYDLWTLKEAYLKARGTGLQLPLGDFGFSFQGDTVLFSAKAGLDPAPWRWRFWCARLAGTFSVSVALESGPVVCEPQLMRMIPLGESVAISAGSRIGSSR
jgi:4'-phosphopantetheinyl transferase